MKKQKTEPRRALERLSKTNDGRKIDKRRILLFLPLFLLPFAALAFYALGGGNKAATENTASAKGINTILPDAQFKKVVPTDKMAIYELTKNDTAHADQNSIKEVAGQLGFSEVNEPQTKQIQSKLAAINREISTPVRPSKSYADAGRGPAPDNAPVSKDISRLEGLMKNMQQNGSDNDPEMAQLNTLMDKILAAQNPGRAKERQVIPGTAVPDSLFKAIPAVIEGNQKATEGSVVKLRLLDTITLNGQLIPKGYFIYGLAAFSNQRLNLEIKNIRLGTSIIPVSLTVFDKTDAMVGINAPDALLTDAVNTGSTDAIGSIGLGFDQSLTTQIAGAGIDAAKGLLTKKLKRIKQKLKAGYPLLLRINKR